MDVRPSVSPRPSSERGRPRSTVSVPVHWVEHQLVEASPSTAADAGDPDAAEEAEAEVVSASAMFRESPGTPRQAGPR